MALRYKENVSPGRIILLLSYTPSTLPRISRSKPADDVGISFSISIPRSPSTERCASNSGVPGISADIAREMKSNTSWSVCLNARLMGNVGKAANRGCSSYRKCRSSSFTPITSACKFYQQALFQTNTRRLQVLETNEEKDVTAVVAAFDRSVLMAGSLSEVNIAVAPGGVLYRLVTTHSDCLGRELE